MLKEPSEFGKQVDLAHHSTTPDESLLRAIMHNRWVPGGTRSPTGVREARRADAVPPITSSTSSDMAMSTTDRWRVAGALRGRRAMLPRGGYAAPFEGHKGLIGKCAETGGSAARCGRARPQSHKGKVVAAAAHNNEVMRTVLYTLHRQMHVTTLTLTEVNVLWHPRYDGPHGGAP
jgi:hypothetical protein